MTPPEPIILIVGAGAFGVSTAYHLAQTYDDPSRVTVIDREASPPSQAAGVDINRIIRADYPSALYCNLANEAMHPWFWSNELGPCFHRVGWLMLDEEGSDLKDRIYETLKARGTRIMQDVGLGDIAAGRRWGVTEGTETAGFGGAYFNPDAGWVDAASATGRFMATALGKGVRRLEGEVVELLVDGGKTARVDGVRTADGREVKADKVVLAAGAWTSRILARTEDALGTAEDDCFERQARATAVVSAYYRVSDESVSEMTDCGMPCVIYGRTGEVVPACKDRKLLKYNNTGTKVVNTVRTESGRHISVPPVDRDQNAIPEGLKQETEAKLTSKLLPKFSRGAPASWRMCWDSWTPTEDLLLCQHPQINNLYIIAGGGFAGYKYVQHSNTSPTWPRPVGRTTGRLLMRRRFMPTIGKYMLNVLGGKSNGPEKDKAFGWKTRAELGAAEMVTRRELGDFEAGGSLSRL